MKFFISSKGVVLEGKQLRKVVEMKTATGRFFLSVTIFVVQFV